MAKNGGRGPPARDSRGRFVRKCEERDTGCRLLPVPAPDIMSLVSFEQRPQDGPRESLTQQLLGPLLEGLPVVLAVTDKRAPKKKRVTGKPLLFLVPASCFGGSIRKIVVSFQAQGCEIVDVDEKVKSISFVRLGLSASLSTHLATALNQVFNK